jgi:carbon-monoxide dehydrogenase large subunit
MAAADWKGYRARQAESQRGGKLRGRSVSYYIEHAGIFNDRMDVRFDPSGAVTILAGTHSHGQGHATAFAQLVSEWLGVPFEKVRYIQGDTDKVPFGRGTYAARSSVIGSAALRSACNAIIEKGRRAASEMLEASVDDVTFEGGMYKVTGTDRMVPIVGVVKYLHRPVHLPDEVGLGLEGSGTYGADIPSYPNGCHVVEVEIDPGTGHVQIDRYTVVDDCGVPINPMICEGQIQGGLAQGIGQALCENVVYDRQSGQLLTGSYMDYGMPRAHDMGTLTTEFVNVPCRTNPVGVKGVGESGTIGAPPAVMNAVIDALRPLGINHVDMPATAPRIWAAIKAAEAAR